MIKKILYRIGASEHPLLKLLAAAMRFPIHVAQWRLLKTQKDGHLVDRVKKIQREKFSLMWPDEMMQVYLCASQAKKLHGDFAEVGVFMGRSAKVICEAKGETPLHLFDTFQGLPQPESSDSVVLHSNQYTARFETVQAYVSGYPHVTLYQGVFPTTAGPIAQTPFAFVHLDVDLYRGTLECLEFFYPRMVRGGLLLSHDYSTLSGVKKAFEEFFADKPEVVVELSTSQCLVVKL